ncbi:MAG: hypothetical protein NVSMB23_20930 [Myxococcales bacterium]
MRAVVDAVPALRAALWGAGAFALGDLLPVALRLPVVACDPILRTIAVTSAPTAAQMRYPGDLLWAWAAAAAAACLGRALPATRPFDARVPAAAALSLVALDLAFHLSRLRAAV